MEKLPKHTQNNIFKAPEGYYDQLADRILSRKERESTRSLMVRWAAAAVFVLGVSLFLFKWDSQKSSMESTAFLLDAEIEWLIENEDWGAEDILTLSEDPNAVIDQFMEEQWSTYHITDEEIDQEMWDN